MDDRILCILRVGQGHPGRVKIFSRGFMLSLYAASISDLENDGELHARWPGKPDVRFWRVQSSPLDQLITIVSVSRFCLHHPHFRPTFPGIIKWCLTVLCRIWYLRLHYWFKSNMPAELPKKSFYQTAAADQILLDTLTVILRCICKNAADRKWVYGWSKKLRTMGKVSHGKTILFGEQAVVYGEPGIAFRCGMFRQPRVFAVGEKKKAHGFGIILFRG